MTFSVLDHYNGFVLNNFIKKDISQTNLLNKISLTWSQYNKSNLFFSKKEKKGIYVYGPVGTGKTFLLSLFSQYSKVGKKIHFNNLMSKIHENINSNENKSKKIELFIKKFFKLLSVSNSDLESFPSFCFRNKRSYVDIKNFILSATFSVMEVYYK